MLMTHDCQWTQVSMTENEAQRGERTQEENESYLVALSLLKTNLLKSSSPKTSTEHEVGENHFTKDQLTISRKTSKQIF